MVPVYDDQWRDFSFKRLVDASVIENSYTITIQEILNAISKQKVGKAVGMDGIAMEAYIYGGLRLMIHVCLLFNLCIKHGICPKGL